MKKIVAACIVFCYIAYGQTGQLIDQLLSPRFVVNFDNNSYRLNTEAKRHLDSLVYLLNHEPLNIQKIEITGYCDSVASYGYNDMLSLKRANAVGDYFKANGVADTLIKTVSGYGKRRQINNNSDSLQRLANRRVEIEFQLAVPQAKQTAAPLSAPITPRPAPQYAADTSAIPKLDMSKIEVGDVIELKDINFYPNRHYLIKQSKKKLQLLLNTLLAYKSLRIEIRGHICCLAPDEGDAADEDSGLPDLSLERAKAIYSYLVLSGIDPNRMTYIGLGAKFPKVEEFTDEDKALNRRVEIKILSK